MPWALLGFGLGKSNHVLDCEYGDNLHANSEFFRYSSRIQGLPTNDTLKKCLNRTSSAKSKPEETRAQKQNAWIR